MRNEHVERRQKLLALQRRGRLDRDISLEPRIDRIIDMQHIAENDANDLPNIRIDVVQGDVALGSDRRRLRGTASDARSAAVLADERP